MALRNPPSWLDAGSTPAENDRLVIAGLLVRPGVVGQDDLKVVASSGLTVSVGAGAAYVQGDVRSNQGVYHVINDSAETVTLAAAPATNPRIDVIIARVKDADAEGTENSASLEAVTGTESSTPTAPVVPKNSLVLAYVNVAVGASSLSSANITDKRGSRATALGGTIVCQSTTRPSGSWVGQEIYETDTGYKRVWSGTAWLTTADTALLPTVFNPPRVHAYQSSPNTLPNAAYYTISMQSTAYDSHTMHSNTTNNERLTCKAAGIYHVTAQIHINTSATGNRIIVIRRNGAGVGFHKETITTAGTCLLNVSADVPMNVNDYLDFQVYQSSGSSLNTTVGAPYTFMQAHWFAPLA